MIQVHSHLLYSVAILVTLALIAMYPACVLAVAPTLPLPAPALNVLTYHNDNARTGLNRRETVLTPANVNVRQFGKLLTYPVDGEIYAQPLFLQNLDIPGRGPTDVVFVATEHDSVYAFDASGVVREPVWKVSFLGDGITTVPQEDVLSTISPEIGITSSPVIDVRTETLYVVAVTKENGNYVQRLHALDVVTGQEKFGGPIVITASIRGNGQGSVDGTLRFDPRIQLQRAALLLANGRIYIAWASHSDMGDYHGWVIAYDAASLRQVGLWNTTPDSFQGGIWMGGGGLAADAAGSIYGIAGNGRFDVPASGASYSDTFFKLSPDLSRIQDWFTPFNQQALAAIDADLGSAAAVLLPDQPGPHRHLVISAGKEGRIYLLDRDHLGHFRPEADSQIVQSLVGALGTGPGSPSYSSPAYWNGWVYFAAADDLLKAFRLQNGRLGTPPLQSGNVYAYPGATPAVSSNGDADGIVWSIALGDNALHAHDAANVSRELYNSNQNAARDALGPAVKFTVPTVVNGRVYVGTSRALVAYGLLD